jgi:hypothetical protein
MAQEYYDENQPLPDSEAIPLMTGDDEFSMMFRKFSDKKYVQDEEGNRYTMRDEETHLKICQELSNCVCFHCGARSMFTVPDNYCLVVLAPDAEKWFVIYHPQKICENCYQHIEVTYDNNNEIVEDLDGSMNLGDKFPSKYHYIRFFIRSVVSKKELKKRKQLRNRLKDLPRAALLD